MEVDEQHPVDQFLAACTFQTGSAAPLPTTSSTTSTADHPAPPQLTSAPLAKDTTQINLEHVLKVVSVSNGKARLMMQVPAREPQENQHMDLKYTLLSKLWHGNCEISLFGSGRVLKSGLLFFGLATDECQRPRLQVTSTLMSHSCHFMVLSSFFHLLFLSYCHVYLKQLLQERNTHMFALGYSDN